MQAACTGILRIGGAAVIFAFLFGASEMLAAGDRPLFIAVGDVARAPIGWIEFCTEYAPECDTRPSEARDVVMSPKVWHDLIRVNKWVNTNVKPLTDVEHWNVVERWNYPDDGIGDCEDYVLLKRRMLIQAGWPREALLITVVRDKKGDGHAVLTVKTVMSSASRGQPA